jgi:2'-hydroxyisoflavone reductase
VKSRALVVGGTGFLGGAIARAASAAGLDVTILSRGIKSSDAKGFEYVIADRLGPIEALQHAKFDAVFDTCAYTPHSVRHLLSSIGDDVIRYVLVSSASVYGDWSQPCLKEDTAVESATDADLAVAAQMEATSALDANNAGDSYGRLKRACEIVAKEMLGERAIILRAGLLIGAGDYTDRMTWWVRRFDEGGKVPVPLPHDRSLQAIDVRDAAAFAVKAALDRQSGIFNLTSEPFPFKHLADVIGSATGNNADAVWLDEDAFFSSGVEPWDELPLIVPQGELFKHFFEVSVQKAKTAGLKTRPLAETVNAILRWDRTRRDVEPSCGLTKPHEAALLRRAI